MSDDRRNNDDFSEYGSLFDESAGTGLIPEVTNDVAADNAEFGSDLGGSDFGDADFGDEGFGDVTWADDAPAVADSTDAEDYQPPVGTEQNDGFNTGQFAADVPDSRATSMFEAVEVERPDAPISEWDRGAPSVGDGGADIGAVERRIGDDEDVDVWSSFNSESPVWDSDGSPVEPLDQPEPAQAQPRRVVVDDDLYDAGAVPPDGDRPPPPDRIQIGTDPASGHRGRDPRELRSRDPRSGGRAGEPRRSGRSQDGIGRSAGSGRQADSGGRDMPMAIAVGMVLVALFLLVLRLNALRYFGVIGLVTVVVGVAGIEFFGRVTDKGYRPATVPGVAACVAAPLVAYWIGDAALPLVLTFGFVAIAISFIGANSVDSAPMPNIAITNLGMIWIGLLGSYAMLILRFSTANSADWASSDNFGTDTLFLLALGVVANDVGALLIGSFVGRTPLRSWISPNKTVEGLIGGTAFTMIALILYRQLVSSASTWTSYADLLILAVVISIMAPLGDLVESMFKRNMDIKDFGTIVRGHGGVLDRFDGFLFALPAVYYLTEVLQPWTAAG